VHKPPFQEQACISCPLIGVIGKNVFYKFRVALLRGEIQGEREKGFLENGRVFVIKTINWSVVQGGLFLPCILVCSLKMKYSDPAAFALGGCYAFLCPNG
jgi:hypothetical protein